MRLRRVRRIDIRLLNVNNMNMTGYEVFYYGRFSDAVTYEYRPDSDYYTAPRCELGTPSLEQAYYIPLKQPTSRMAIETFFRYVVDTQASEQRINSR